MKERGRGEEESASPEMKLPPDFFYVNFYLSLKGFERRNILLGFRA